MRHGKRALDVVLGGVLVVVTSPIQIGVAIAVRRALGRPVLFRQTRPGLNAKPFKMLKFRTMTDARDENGELLPDQLRLPRFGRFLRSTSLDELPELVNVLRGDISLVGPRPLLMTYLNRYSPRQTRRHAVKPGVTGLAQVSGRNNLTWDEKFELDLEYVENVSLRLDLQVLIRTVVNVLARKDINASDNVTMPEFGVSNEAA